LAAKKPIPMSKKQIAVTKADFSISFTVSFLELSRKSSPPF